MNLKQSYTRLYALLFFCGYTPLLLAQGYTTHQGLKVINPSAPTNVITLNPPSSITSYTLTLPSAAGSNGQVLQTDGIGNLSWATVGTGTVTGSGTATQVAYWSSSSALTSSSNLYWDNTNTRLGIGTNSPTITLHSQIATSGGSITSLPDANTALLVKNTVNGGCGGLKIQAQSSGGSTFTGNIGINPTYFNGNGAFGFLVHGLSNSGFSVDLTNGNTLVGSSINGVTSSRLTVNGNLAVGSGYVNSSAPTDGAIIQGNVAIGNSSVTSGATLDVRGHTALSNSGTASELRFYEPSADGSNYTAFKAQTQAGDITYTLPASLPPSAGYLLSSSTTGVMSWTSPLSLGDMIRFARKTANEAISSTSIQADDHISFSLGANEIWEIDGVLDMDCSSTSQGGIKLSFDAPTGSTLNCHVFILAGYNSSTTDEIRLLLESPGTALGWSTVKSNNAVYLKGIVTTSATSGTLQLNWALNSSGATTTVKTNSYVKLLRIQ